MVPAELPSPDHRPLDDLLESIATCGAELDNGLTNHAPMVLEALCSLGRPDAAAPWLATYRPHLLPWPPPHDPIDPDDCANAVGDPARLTDWHRYFVAALDEASWRTVVASWVPQLAPGLSGAATHGVIRTGHAVRALASGDTAPRRRELAAAFAYWAASYRALPRSSADLPRAGAADWALAQVPLLPPHARHHRGSIDAALAPLADWPEFERVADLLDVERDPEAVADELLLLFAKVLLANAKDFITAIVFVHAITSLVALIHLLPLLEAAEQRRVLGFGWQASAALYAVYGTRAPPRIEADCVAIGSEASSRPEDASMLIATAIETGDEHAIKCTEACLVAYRRHASPFFLAAAAHATHLLARS